MTHQDTPRPVIPGAPGELPKNGKSAHTACPPLNQTCGYNHKDGSGSTPAPADVVRPAQAARNQSASGNGSRSSSGTVRNTTAGISATFKITLREQEAKPPMRRSTRPLYGRENCAAAEMATGLV